MNGDPRRSVWQRVGDTSPKGLADARLQLHWAVQLLAAVGQWLVVPKADDSHRGMVYDANAGRFVGELTATDPQVCMRVRPADLRVFLTDGRGAELDSVGMDGMTLEAARDWTAQALARVLDRDPVLPRPEYDMPDHAVTHGAPFAADDLGALAELGRWFGNAEAVLEEVASTAPGSSAVRVWPHHFDIGMLITLDGGMDPETARTVGVGFSPGDQEIPEPYWYVNVYPRPDASATDLPPLPAGGRWNTEKGLGAILTGSSVASLSSAEEQREGSLQFLRTTIATARVVLEVEDALNR